MIIKLKPLSQNEAWQGRRFKTKKYKQFENDLLYLLPPITETDFSHLDITFGFSNVLSDIDNPTKMVLDIMQKRYGFNDKEITTLILRKEIVKKGNEFMKIIIG